MSFGKLIQAALFAVQDEHLAEADELVAEALSASDAPQELLDLVKQADEALGDDLLELAERHLQAVLSGL